MPTTNESSIVVLAADLGGTNIRMAAITGDGEILHRIESRTPRGPDDSGITLKLAEMRSELASRLGFEPFGLGVAAASIIDPVNGILTSSPNIPELNGSHLPRILSEMIASPVHLENDATAAAIGEQWLGASKGVQNSICITLGTGVGGGIILDGKAYRGIDGTAGEVGHAVVEYNGHPCGCGNLGCLEQYASATAVVRLATEGLVNYPLSSLAGISDIKAKDVFDAAASGDELAVSVFNRMSSYLGAAITGLVNILNPEMVVIGGGLSGGWEVFGGGVREYVNKKAFRRPAERVRIVRAELGDDAGVFGVAKTLFDIAEGSAGKI